MNPLTSLTGQRPRHEADQCAYESDFSLWIEAQLDILRAKKFELLDLDNVIEEFESMGGNQRRELASKIEVLLMHLLKCRYQPEKKSSSWLKTIMVQHSELSRLLKQSPSLKRHVNETADEGYAHAVRLAALDTGLRFDAFPPSNPFASDQLLDPDFLP